MAKSAGSLARKKNGPNRINEKGGEEDTILSGTDREQMQDLDGRVPEQPRQARKTEVDRSRQGATAQEMRRR